MGCSTCGGGSVANHNLNRTTSFTVNNYSTDCSYTMEQLQVWVNLLVCAKDKTIYPSLGLTAQQLNKYLGIAMSALNYPTYPCYFAKELAPIGDVIILLQNDPRC
jgi:hypothetical protein